MGLGPHWAPGLGGLLPACWQSLSSPSSASCSFPGWPWHCGPTGRWIRPHSSAAQERMEDSSEDGTASLASVGCDSGLSGKRGGWTLPLWMPTDHPDAHLTPWPTLSTGCNMALLRVALLRRSLASLLPSSRQAKVLVGLKRASLLAAAPGSAQRPLFALPLAFFLPGAPGGLRPGARSSLGPPLLFTVRLLILTSPSGLDRRQAPVGGREVVTGTLVYRVHGKPVCSGFLVT